MDRVACFHRAAWGCAVAVTAFLASQPVGAQIAAPGSPAVVVAPSARPNAAPAAPAGPNCVIPQDYARFDRPLPRTQRRLLAGQQIKIVAIGSSSTFGAGASKPYNAYPSRLAAELSREFVDHDIKVINRGVNGDTATDMLARFEQGVIGEKPDLVLWQVGTNSLLRGDPIAPHRSLLHGGIVRLKAINADVVLIDPQYAPRVLARPNHDQMLDLLKQTARVEAVNLFQRFALMRHWREVERIPFEAFLSPDELHMNDFSYGCVARALGGAISEALTRPVLSATAPMAKAKAKN
jgi:lysophospholipase L1-like esterase